MNRRKNRLMRCFVWHSSRSVELTDAWKPPEESDGLVDARKPPGEEYEMKRILIVEDDMALAQELQYLLISNQYDAQCVGEFNTVWIRNI